MQALLRSSAQRRSGFTRALALGAVLLSGTTAAASARLVPARETVIAAPGGALLIPLRIEQPLLPEPSSSNDIDLRLNVEINGERQSAYLGARMLPRSTEKAWADPLVSLDIAPVSGRSASPRDAVGYFAALPAPSDPDVTTLIVNDSPVGIRWADANRAYTAFPLPTADRPRLEAVRALDRPDPRNPDAHWRWVLLADRLNCRPPTLGRFDPLGALVARAGADRWRIGLARLAEGSPGVAAACRDALTVTVTDRDITAAAWEMDPSAIGTLLNSLLNPDLSPEALVTIAMDWLESRRAVLVWVDQPGGEQLEIRALNRDVRDQIVRWAWRGLDAVPIAVTIPARSIGRIIVDRPEVDADLPLPPLVITTSDDEELEISASPWPLAAEPPAVVFPPFRPALTLAEITLMRQRVVTEDRATSIHLRHRAGRWELFVECRRPEAAAGPSEVVTILIGPRGASGIALRVPEVGMPLQRGAEVSGEAETTVRSWADRWYARIVLPERWLIPVGDALAVSIGAIREHGDSDLVETSPAVSLPWRVDPGRIGVALDTWE